MTDHKITCREEVIPCAQCQEPHKRREMSHHQDFDCEEQITSCEAKSCKKKIARKNQQAHARTCPEIKEICKRECGLAVKRKYMDLQLDGQYSHDCICYLRTKLIQKKDKSTFLKQSKKYEQDIHKVFCKESCKSCDGDKELSLIPFSEIPYDQRVLNAFKLGISNLANLSLNSGYLVKSNVIKKAQEELIVSRFTNNATSLIHFCD